MRNMMLPVRNFSKIVLCSMLLLAAGCKDNYDPFKDQGNTEDPQWVITVDNNLPSSLTAVVRVSFAQSEGTLAAFMGDECCGIADYIDGLYWLYVSPAGDTNTNIQLRFYSPKLKRIFVATETIPFRDNAIIGDVEDPYTPSWTVKQ